MRKPAFYASLVLTAGCLVQHGRGEPLYPITGQRPPPDRVAQLDGYIRKVDDKPVDQEKSYELLPGCHLIGTPARWGSGSESGGVLVDTGAQTFTLVMKRGHHYHVAVSVKSMGGANGTAAIEAYEQDPKGNKTVVAGEGINVATAEACKEAE